MTLSTIGTNVGNLRTACDEEIALSAQCPSIPPSTTFQNGANYNNVSFHIFIEGLSIIYILCAITDALSLHSLPLSYLM